MQCICTLCCYFARLATSTMLLLIIGCLDTTTTASTTTTITRTTHDNNNNINNNRFHRLLIKKFSAFSFFQLSLYYFNKQSVFPFINQMQHTIYQSVGRLHSTRKCLVKSRDIVCDGQHYFELFIVYHRPTFAF